MAKKMLIDARHFEEMRMAITDGTRLENLEIESFNKKQIKGSIYLAKVMRIEPSLQAAFVEFGGNRQGFLSFSEIHPDYYQIPVADRLLLEKELQKASMEKSEPSVLDGNSAQDNAAREEEHEDAALIEREDEGSMGELPLEHQDALEPTEDDLGEDSPRRFNLRHRYKIQEVIKRGQVMLVQVVREERSSKGAALTTYMSLPGRYCVLMPNSGERRGGISRKITDSTTRKRLRKILDSFDLLEGMSLIVRTAGSDKNKTELKKDFEYLLRLWADIREKTLESIAPTMIYAEGDLIKRALRDTYTKDIEHIIIEGDDAYKSAKAFMKTVSPSHAKKVQQHKDKTISLFQAHHVDELVDQILSPSVPLPSGGSLVIAQTEALVAIDVNSGKSTRERHIDETAIKTNLEAAREIGRQLRLRDLAGIIVIDFIDMRDSKHNAQVERALKESLSSDRARIQIGRISQFGLLELSRQRLRSSVIESNTHSCPHCHGSGVVRSVESMGLFLLRKMEAIAIKYFNQSLQTLLNMSVYPGVDQYLLNHKRKEIVALEEKYNVTIAVQTDHHMVHVGYHFTVKDKNSHTVLFSDDGRSLVPTKHSKSDHAHKVRTEEDSQPSRDKKDNASSSWKKNNSKGQEKRSHQKQDQSVKKQDEQALSLPKDDINEQNGEISQKKSRRRRRKNRNGDQNPQQLIQQPALDQPMVEAADLVASIDPMASSDPMTSVQSDQTSLNDVSSDELKEKRSRRRRPRRHRSSNRQEGEISNNVPSAPENADPVTRPAAQPYENTVHVAANTQIKGNAGVDHEALEKVPSKKKRKGLWERLFDS